jgi:O-Antigen ligase
VIPRSPYIRSLLGNEFPLVAGLSALTLLLALAATHKLGTTGLLAPLALVILIILLLRPLLTMTLIVGVIVLCEGSTFGILTFGSKLYEPIAKDLTILDGLVALAVVSVLLDLIRNRRALWIPAPLRLPFAILALAMVAGAITGHANGTSLHLAISSEHVLLYLLLVPIAIANIEIDRRQVAYLLKAAIVVAIIKAGIGLIEIAGGYGQALEETTRITYYEPTANWLIMITLFGILATLLARVKLPLWIVLGTPLLFASLLLSYRRSFWIAAVLGFLLVLIVGTSPAGRRALLPVGLATVAAIWILGSVKFQSQIPLVKRAASLNPTKLETNADDRYRLDERANVLGEIKQHPIAGLGLDVPWAATVQPLSVEHPEGRQYVHFAALWFWLKLGVLGLIAYLALLLTSAVLSWQAWRRSHEPLLRAFGLASLCGTAGLSVIETTASFTGVDPRFTLLLAAQIGLLAVIAGRGHAAGGLSSRFSRRLIVATPQSVSLHRSHLLSAELSHVYPATPASGQTSPSD